MSTAIRSRARGVTLLELLVVLMILSIVLTAAVRTWDVTLERGRAETTARKLNQLVQAIIGDPDYIVAGHRADFGFVGDMGRLPDSLRELVFAPAATPPESSRWRGPYLRSTFNESPDGFQIDGWGDTIVYGRQYYRTTDSLFVRSYGGRGMADHSRWQTLYLPHSNVDLTSNQVEGSVVDVRGDGPPGVLPSNLRLKVTLYYPRDGKLTEAIPGTVIPRFTFTGVPQGTHRIQAMLVNFDSIPHDTALATQDITVYPRIGVQNVMLRLPVDWP